MSADPSTEVNHALAFVQGGAVKAKAAHAAMLERGDQPFGPTHRIRRLLYECKAGPGEMCNVTSMRGGSWFVTKDVWRTFHKHLHETLLRNDWPFSLVEKVKPRGRLFFDFDGQPELKDAGKLEHGGSIAELIARTVLDVFAVDAETLRVYVSRSSEFPDHKVHYSVPAIVLLNGVREQVTELLRDRLMKRGLPIASARLDLECRMGLRLRGSLKWETKRDSVRGEDNGRWLREKGTYPRWTQVWPSEGYPPKPALWECTLLAWDEDPLTPFSAKAKELLVTRPVAQPSFGSCGQKPVEFTDSQREEARRWVETSEFMVVEQRGFLQMRRQWVDFRLDLDRVQRGACPCGACLKDGSPRVHDKRGAYVVLARGGREYRLHCWCGGGQRRVLWSDPELSEVKEVESDEDDDQGWQLGSDKGSDAGSDEDLGTDDDESQVVDEDDPAPSAPAPSATPAPARSSARSSARAPAKPTHEEKKTSSVPKPALVEAQQLEERALRRSLDAKIDRQRAKALRNGQPAPPLLPTKRVDTATNMPKEDAQVPFPMTEIPYRQAAELYVQKQGQGLAELFVLRTKDYIKRDRVGDRYYVLDTQRMLWVQKAQLDVSYYMLPVLAALVDHLPDAETMKAFRKQTDAGSVSRLDVHLKAAFNVLDVEFVQGMGQDRRLGRFCQHLDLRRDLIPTRGATVVDLGTGVERTRTAEDGFTKELPVRLVSGASSRRAAAVGDGVPGPDRWAARACSTGAG